MTFGHGLEPGIVLVIAFVAVSCFALLVLTVAIEAMNGNHATAMLIALVFACVVGTGAVFGLHEEWKTRGKKR